MVVIGVDIAEKDSVEVGSSDNMFRSDAGCLLVRKQLVPFLKKLMPLEARGKLSLAARCYVLTDDRYPFQRAGPQYVSYKLLQSSMP